MVRPLARIVLLVGASCVAACDSVEGEAPASTFPAEDPFARQIIGRVLQGTEPVPGALVRVDVGSFFASDLELAATSEEPRTASADASGFYRVRFAPALYDLSVRRERVLLVMRGAGARLLEPQLGADAPVTGFRAQMVPRTDPPPRAGNAVAYLVSGADARALTGDSGSGSFEVTFRRFDTTVTLHALEYVVADGLTSIVRSGKATVRVRDGEASSPAVATTDVTTKKKVTFEATLPEGFTMSSLEVELDGGLRTSAVVAARPVLGVPIDLSIVPDLAYSVRGRATSGAAVSYSGRPVFDPSSEKVTLTFPTPVSAESPIDDDVPPLGPASGGLAPVTLEAGGELEARFHDGILEHVLSPVSGDGTIVRIVTDARVTTLPDTTVMGLPQPVGRYEWTLEHFPTLPFVDRLTGADARVAPPSWKSAPKTITLR